MKLKIKILNGTLISKDYVGWQELGKLNGMFQWDVPMGWLLIDTLAHNFMKNWNFNDKSYFYYDFMIRDFFEYLKNQNKDKKYWLAVWSNQQVYRKWSFEHKALRCYNIALDAIQNEKNWYTVTATNDWKKIFWNKFTW